MKKAFLFFIIIGTLVFLIFAPMNVGAQRSCPEPAWCNDPTEISEKEKTGGLVPCGRPCNDPSTADCETEPCTLCHLFVMLNRILAFLLVKIVPTLAALMIAIGGLMYVVAYASQSGGPEMLGRAKKLFTAVVIGLIIIYFAWAFLGLFFQTIGLNVDWLSGYKDWWESGFYKIDCN